MIRGFILSIFFFLLLPLGAQEAPREYSLLEKAQIKDIETSNYYELLAWTRLVGLSDQGSAGELRKALLEYYGLTPLTLETRDEGIATIMIRSAHSTEYFTLEESDENMVILRGGVIIEMEERGDNPRTHTVEAEEVVFNQDLSIITARGNVKYILEKDGAADTFYGDSLSFSMTTWAGIIFKGSGSQEQTLEEGTQTFYFSGELLRKAGDGNVVIMEDGIITSQKMRDPDYRIRASRLWIMGPGEWGVARAILYMGHVPVFYFPFFYKPGNEIFFNPALGIKNRQGAFLQTTTYLIGRKPKDENSSLFGEGFGGAGEYVLEREGLYLMKTDPLPADQIKPDYLKLMVDVYSRLGIYTGIAGSFISTSQADLLDFQFGLGLSREIDERGNVYFKDTTTGEIVSVWDSTSIGNLKLPFRFGWTTAFELDTLNGEFSFYSDPYFNQDFMEREENFDWINTLTANESEDRIPDIITDMIWRISYSKSGNPPVLSPYIESISLSSLRMEMEWYRRVNPSASVNSPSRTFFYPEKIIYPNGSASISGTPLSYNSHKGWGWSGQKSEELLPLTPPTWEESEEADESREKPKEKEGLELGDFYARSFSPSDKTAYDMSFGYTLDSSINLEGLTNHDGWDDPAEITLDLKENTLQTANRLTTTFNNRFFDDTLIMENINTYTHNYKNRLSEYDPEGSVSGNSQRQSDYGANSVLWKNIYGMTYSPFLKVKGFQGIQAKYVLNNDLYTRTFRSYTPGFAPEYNITSFEWDRESISQHNGEVVLEYSPRYVFVRSSLLVDLPPLGTRRQVTSAAGFDIFNWETTFSNTFVNTEDNFIANPLILTSVYTPLDWFKVDQRLEYSLKESTFSLARSTLEFFGFYLSYTHEYTTTYSWDTTLGWVPGSTKEFVPSRLDTGYKFQLRDISFWESRITLNTDFDFSWKMDLQQVTDNVLSLRWGVDFDITEFLNLGFSMSSSNKSMYRYISAFRKKLQLQQEYSFWKDLLMSLNIFSPGQQDRLDAQFNLQNISLDITHRLREWDLSVVYTGYPQVAGNQYEWYSEITIAVNWNPIPQLKLVPQKKGDVWTIDNS